MEKDFSSFFFTQYGNCYTYNLHLPEKENFEDSMEELAQNQQFHEDNEESLSGFTGPQVGISERFLLDASSISSIGEPSILSIFTNAFQT